MHDPSLSPSLGRLKRVHVADACCGALIYLCIDLKVDPPELLIRSPSDSQLVIFAGVGVWMGSPANSRNCWNTARRVAGDAMRPPIDEEPLDRYLGQTEALGVEVPGRTREISDDPKPQPTTQHR